MDFKEAALLIQQFAINQSNITKAANSKRGVTNKLIKEEKTLIENLLQGLKVSYSPDELTALISSIG